MAELAIIAMAAIVAPVLVAFLISLRRRVGAIAATQADARVTPRLSTLGRAVGIRE